MYIVLKGLIFSIITGLGVIIVWKYLYFLKLRRRFGIETSKNVFLDNLNIKFLIPKRGSKSYQRIETILLNVGSRLKVETFYALRYLLIFVILISSYLVLSTNTGIDINNIRNDINFNRSMADYQVQPTEELVNLEIEILEESKEYLKQLGVSPVDPLAADILESYIRTKDLVYDSPSSLANRIISKLSKEREIQTDYKIYLTMFLLAYMSYYAPYLLLAIKMKLIDSKKDWEILHCFTTYSIVANLPPYRVDSTLEELIDVSRIYKPIFERFKGALQTGDAETINNLVEEVQDDDMQELLEILILASEIGINHTVGNIDDLLELKIRTLEIEAKKKRQVKSLICMFPVFIVLFMLFMYLLYGMTTISQNMFISI